MKNLIFLLIAISSSSCMSTIMDDDYSSIDPKLNKYVVEFVNEAANHGIQIDTWNLKLLFGKCPKGVAAQTTYSTTTIIIDTLQFNKSTKLEEVVLHEFGHLYLHREHDDETMISIESGNEVSKSLMTTKASIKYANDFDRKPYYMNELFNENTPKPNWAKLT